MRRLFDLVPSPAERKPLTGESFLQELLPVIVLYYVTAFLVVTRGTLAIRVALLPVTLWAAFRAATGLRVDAGNPRLVYWNQALVLAMTTLGMRVIIWTCQPEHYVRHTSQTSCDHKPSANRRIWDALDLCGNVRGIGWNWSNGLHLPKETRSISRAAFASTTALQCVCWVLAFDFVHFSVQFFDPGFALPTGASIYDMSLPPIPRYLRSSMICFLAGLTFWSAIQMLYHVGTLVGILVLQQHPSQWPPVFGNPLLADSLSDYWAKRWHQLFRQCFVSLGFKPLSFFAGRAGGVLGAFFISGMLHDFALWGMGRGSEPSSMYTYFLMMGVGVVLEGFWKYVTGYRVGGILGRIWGVVWLTGWSHLFIDAYCRKGVVASIFFPDAYRPSLVLLRFVQRILML
ncbi:hypothetical protein APHAL10511_004532 [Amanita phalloides]|nr:hypothetical protein APHAL10511_004532 [Amanita phalloides]